MNQGYPPRFPPGRYDPDGVMRNPGNTVPFPMPQDIPTPCWYGDEVQLIWGTGNVTGSLAGTVWRSPVFDFRPDLRAGAPASPQGVQPIWRPFGAGGVLHVLVDFGPGSQPEMLSGLNVCSIERAHPWDPTRMVRVTQPQDVTAPFTVNKDAAWLRFMNDATNPIRYWSVELQFDLFLAHAAPNFVLTAGLY